MEDAYYWCRIIVISLDLVAHVAGAIYFIYI